MLLADLLLHEQVPSDQNESAAECQMPDAGFPQVCARGPFTHSLHTGLTQSTAEEGQEEDYDVSLLVCPIVTKHSQMLLVPPVHAIV